MTQIAHSRIIRPLGLRNVRRGQTVNVVFSEISFRALFVKPNRLNKNFLLANSPETYWREKETNIFIEAVRIKDTCFDLGLINDGFIDWYTKIEHGILKGFGDFGERHVIAELNHIYKMSFVKRGIPNKKAKIINEALLYNKNMVDYIACKKISSEVTVDKTHVIIPLELIRFFEEKLFFD